MMQPVLQVSCQKNKYYKTLSLIFTSHGRQVQRELERASKRDEINSWMCQNFLQLNKEKTEVIAFGNKDEVLKVNAYLDSRGQTTKIKSEILG